MLCVAKTWACMLVWRVRFETIVFHKHVKSILWCKLTDHWWTHENMTLKIILKRQPQPHWNTSKSTLKSLTKDNHTEIFFVITLKFVSNCYSRILSLHNPTELTEKLSALLISFVISIFSVTLVFQCDFQYILIVLIDTY